MLGRQTK